MLAECIRTLRSETIDESILLSRRHRWKPLAMDVHDGVGVVLVARRGKRAGLGIRLVGFDLHQEPPGLLHMQGGYDDDAPVLAARATIAEWGAGPLMVSSLSGSDGWWWLCAQVKEDARSWELRGTVRPVAAHGWLVAIGRDGRRPEIPVFDRQGNTLGMLSTTMRSLRPPGVLPDDTRGWLNYRPRGTGP